MSDSRLRCFAITGPTACGKTDAALALAEEFPLEIVSMDSAMVYRGMDIGTAKPDCAVRKRVPHHLIDILDPEDSYSAGRFASDATKLVADIRRRGRYALVVGGTMLYLKTLRDGIAPLPERDLQVRADLDRRAREAGWPALHADLRAIDPAAARRIEPTDRQRIQRALEVHAVTGRTLTELQSDTPPSGIEVESVALMPSDRSRLAGIIERRFMQMLADGFVDEVRRLRERPGLSASSQSMRAVGYRQIWAHLDGRWDRAEATARAITATRQLAKRQLTWLRQDESTEKLEAGGPALLETLRRGIDRHVQTA